jgi:hypothetical protein
LGQWSRSDRSRDVDAKRRRLKGGVLNHALFQVHDVPMANLLRGDRDWGDADFLPQRGGV